MRKVFDVELGAGNDRCTELTLPATPWSMQDALEKLKLKKDEVPRWEILRTHGYDSLYFYLDRDGSLFELNALCQRLSQLDERQTAVVKGLAKAEFDQGVRPVPMGRIIDMAYSTDRCHFLSGIMTDAQLGRSCAENDLVPEVADLSDSLFEMLNFEKIGREFRQAEGGVLTKDGYVQRHDELRQISKTMNFTPIKPDYAILVRMASSCEVKLPLPLGEIVGDEPVLCIDCAAPGLIGSSGGMEQMDQLQAVNAIALLADVGSELVDVVKGACGTCAQQIQAGKCALGGKGDPEQCPMKSADGPGVTLTDDLREQAGIPLDAKLEIFVDEGEIMIAAADHEHDVTDVPPVAREVLALAGICPYQLDLLIMSGKIIHEA